VLIKYRVGWISVGSYYAKNAALQWRLPLALAAVGPLILLIGLPFIPESPRYLCWVGRYDEALVVLKRLHYNPADPEHSLAGAEFVQIKAQVDYDKNVPAGYIDVSRELRLSSYLTNHGVQLFRNPAWRKRTLLVIFIMFAQQCSGVNGIASFLIPIAQSLGYTGVQPLILSACYSIVGTIAVVTGCFTIDRLGRRTSFLWGFPSLAAILLIEAMLQLKYRGTENVAGLRACIAFMFIYIAFYQMLDAPSYIWVSEVLPTTIRAKGMGIAIFTYMIGFITWTAPGALAFSHLNWGMYLIFAGLCLIGGILTYFLIPETKGLPIEEIGALFGDIVVAHLTEDGYGIVEKSEDLTVPSVDTMKEI
jgi:hypothetical protein